MSAQFIQRMYRDVKDGYDKLLTTSWNPRLVFYMYTVK